MLLTPEHLCIATQLPAGLAGTYQRKAILYKDRGDDDGPFTQHSFRNAAAFEKFLRSLGVAGLLDNKSPPDGPLLDYSEYGDLQARR